MRNPFSRKRPAVTPEVVAELHTQARRAVWPGFRALDEARRVVLAGRAPDLEAVCAQVVDDEWAARTAELDGTDGGAYDRLVAAFSALESEGILARMHWGSTPIDAERTPAPVAAGGYPWAQWAYTYFTADDAERLADPDPTLQLTFSSFRAAPDADPADIAAGRAGDQEAMRRVIAHTDAVVGRAVVTALVEAGLTVSWDGTAAQRIGVVVRDWRKPLPAADPS